MSASPVIKNSKRSGAPFHTPLQTKSAHVSAPDRTLSGGKKRKKIKEIISNGKLGNGIVSTKRLKLNNRYLDKENAFYENDGKGNTAYNKRLFEQTPEITKCIQYPHSGNEITKDKIGKNKEKIPLSQGLRGIDNHAPQPTRKLDFTSPPAKSTIAMQNAELAQKNTRRYISKSSDNDGAESDESEDSIFSDDSNDSADEVISKSRQTNVVKASGFKFSIKSTVSSMALTPKGDCIVVGFVNGAIYLYPLPKDIENSDRSQKRINGIRLDHIAPRGMYTQLRVKVMFPEDGKFLFAGVYRGSTEIRAFDMSSLKFPPLNGSTNKVSSISTKSISAITHTFSDAKLKGFAAVKSVRRNSTRTEYHLLSGLGIKNIHLWRFYCDTKSKEWKWECMLSQQANGISLEYISFHPKHEYEVISKSQHQNLRVWTFSPENVNDFTSKWRKKKHVDIKQTTDITTVCGDIGYGGSETFAILDLNDRERLELELPDMNQEKNSFVSSQVSFPSRGRHMRVISHLSGSQNGSFVVGLCSDGGVFLYEQDQLLMQYIKGYEDFFRNDSSLDFQAQFSDLTRVNASGLLFVLQQKTESNSNNLFIAAANDCEVLVRSLPSFRQSPQLSDDEESTVSSSESDDETEWQGNERKKSNSKAIIVVTPPKAKVKSAKSSHFSASPIVSESGQSNPPTPIQICRVANEGIEQAPMSNIYPKDKTLPNAFSDIRRKPLNTDTKKKLKFDTQPDEDSLNDQNPSVMLDKLDSRCLDLEEKIDETEDFESEYDVEEMGGSLLTRCVYQGAIQDIHAQSTFNLLDEWKKVEAQQQLLRRCISNQETLTKRRRSLGIPSSSESRKDKMLQKEQLQAFHDFKVLQDMETQANTGKREFMLLFQ